MLSNEIDEVAKTSDDQFAEAFALVLKTVDSAIVPLSSRARIDTQLVPLRERAKKLRKAAAAGSRDLAIDFARQLVPESSGIVIARVDMAGDRDALLAALDTVRGNQPEAPVLLLSADLEEKKVSIVAAGAGGWHCQGLKAGDWARGAAEACGGKGGASRHGPGRRKRCHPCGCGFGSARHFANEQLGLIRSPSLKESIMSLNRRQFSALAGATMTCTCFRSFSSETIFRNFFGPVVTAPHDLWRQARQHGVPEYTKKEFGIEAVEYVNQFFKDKAEDKTYLQELKNRCDDLASRAC